MDAGREFRFIAEKAYSIPGRGVVVTGRVERGSVSVGDEVGFLGSDGRYVAGQVAAIEVSRRLVDTAEAGSQASLLLQGVKKDQITLGTVFTALPESAPAPVVPSTPTPYETPSYRPPSTTSPPPSGRPIHPSSTSWRLIFWIVVAVLIILFIASLQGKWDPKKWDPRRKLAGVESILDRAGAPAAVSAVRAIGAIPVVEFYRHESLLKVREERF